MGKCEKHAHRILDLLSFIPDHQDTFLWNYSCLLMSLAKSSLCDHEPIWVIYVGSFYLSIKKRVILCHTHLPKSVPPMLMC